MSFQQNDVFNISLIGFDMIDGPFLKWRKNLHGASPVDVNLDDFAMNFYLAFRGGNDGMKPRAIMYEDFSIVAFPRGLELMCLFLKSQATYQSLGALQKLATRQLARLDAEELAEDPEPTDDGLDPAEDTDEIKRIIVNLLANTQMSTPELRRYFKLTNSQVWKIMSALEADSLVARVGKDGRAILWTAG